MKNSKNMIVGLGVAACALCCLLPIAGSVLGLTLLATLASWMEVISLIAIGIGILGFLINYLQKKNANKACTTSCSTDCNCSATSLRTEENTTVVNVYNKL